MKKPFFARYLEGQKPEEKSEDQEGLKTGLKAGRPLTTLKYPSDRDEAVTLKYPSDGDELRE